MENLTIKDVSIIIEKFEKTYILEEPLKLTYEMILDAADRKEEKKESKYIKELNTKCKGFLSKKEFTVGRAIRIIIHWFNNARLKVKN